MGDTELALSLVEGIRSVIEDAVRIAGTTQAVKPGHRVTFVWPPPAVSKDFRVPPSAWNRTDFVELDGERIEIKVAETAQGVFGRSDRYWLEARGDNHPAMKSRFLHKLRPLFERQALVGATLGAHERYLGRIRDLEPLLLLRLLYCSDRDVVHEARIEIETHARQGSFTPALIEVLKDRRHPYRRSAQWAVLDLFEDLPGFCPDESLQAEALLAMRGLLWDAEDDFARTTFKAGVVLGGHLPGEVGGPILLDCLAAPSAIGRRSAMHGLYHVVEWSPEMRDQVVSALTRSAAEDSEPLLREYATHMARDIANGSDHVDEPALPCES